MTTAIDGILMLPTEGLEDNLQAWIQQQAKNLNLKLKYLLAHADDGVIWGYFKQEELITSNCVLSQSPPLRVSTLQQCRVFGTAGEVLLWKAGNQWRSRFIGNPDLDRIEEEQVLWGTHGHEHKNEGFTVLQDGSQGLSHAVPLTGIKFDKDRKTHPIRLKVYHYIKYDDDGVARINLSRLVDLTTRSKQENV